MLGLRLQTRLAGWGAALWLFPERVAGQRSRRRAPGRLYDGPSPGGDGDGGEISRMTLTPSAQVCIPVAHVCMPLIKSRYSY